MRTPRRSSPPTSRTSAEQRRGDPERLTAIRVATRTSALATSQSEAVAALITERLGRACELVAISTEGDRSQASSVAIAESSSTGVFVNALREALLDGRADVAVHSLKDLPTTPPVGIRLAAVPGREDPRDVVVARDGLTLGELPVGSRVGTGSPRRMSQLLALGLGLDVVPVRGNVDSRIDKVRRGEYDAVVLARAGLARLQRLEEASEVLDPLQMLPAPGQGALAIECADEALADQLAELDDPLARAAVEAERSLLATLEGGCSAPIGALAEVVEGEDGEELWLRAVALSRDGALDVRRSGSGPLDDAAGLGKRVAAEMLIEGADRLDAGAARLDDETDTPPSDTDDSTESPADQAKVQDA